VFALGILTSAMLFFGAEFILQFFGEAYLEAALPLRIFIVGIMVNLLTGPGLLVLNMTGYQRDGTIVMGVSAVINVLLNAWFIPKWGALGAAAATSISLGGYNVAAAVIAWYRLKLVTFALRRP
jgi:O-antigen/teichoic acid export membrane protein